MKGAPRTLGSFSFMLISILAVHKQISGGHIGGGGGVGVGGWLQMVRPKSLRGPSRKFGSVVRGMKAA